MRRARLLPFFCNRFWRGRRVACGSAQTIFRGRSARTPLTTGATPLRPSSGGPRELVEVPAVLLKQQHRGRPRHRAAVCQVEQTTEQPQGLPSHRLPSEPERSPAFEPGFHAPYSFCSRYCTTSSCNWPTAARESGFPTCEIGVVEHLARRPASRSFIHPLRKALKAEGWVGGSQERSQG